MQRNQLKCRWLMLVLAAVALIGNNYCYDNPAALKSQLQTHFSNISPARYEFLFGLMYTLCAVPNIVLPMFGGFLVDKLGTGVMMLTLCIIVALGQVIVAIGSTVGSILLMLAGRVIFGIGSASLGVTQITLLSSWFTKTEQALAIGISSSVSTLLGSVLNNELSPYIAALSNVSYAFWFGLMLCEISLIAAILIAHVERKTEYRLKRCLLSQHNPLQERDAKISISLNDIRMFRPTFWLLALCIFFVCGCICTFNNVASSLLMERNYFKDPPNECSRCGVGMYEASPNCTDIAPGCPSAPPFSYPLPQLSASCKVQAPQDQLQCSVTPPWIGANAIDCNNPGWKFGYKTSKYCKAKEQAAEASAIPMSVPYTILAILAPFFGLVVGSVGMRAIIILFSTFFIGVAHLLLGLTNVNVWSALILQGIATCAFNAAIWTSIPYLIEEHHVGSAYGIMTAFVNFGLALCPLAVASVYDGFGQKYIPSVEVFFAALAFVGTMISIVVNFVDCKDGTLLGYSRETEAFMYMRMKVLLR